jgi:hypothetical protein
VIENNVSNEKEIKNMRPYEKWISVGKESFDRSRPNIDKRPCDRVEGHRRYLKMRNAIENSFRNAMVSRQCAVPKLWRQLSDKSPLGFEKHLFDFNGFPGHRDWQIYLNWNLDNITSVIPDSKRVTGNSNGSKSGSAERYEARPVNFLDNPNWEEFQVFHDPFQSSIENNQLLSEQQ